MRSSNAKLRLRCALIFAALLFLTISVSSLGRVKPLELWGSKLGAPVIVRRASDAVCADIRQIASDSKALYLLYGQYGVVQAYDLDGTYRYSISLYSHSNGAFRIAAEEGTLYVLDKESNLYCFRDGSFSGFVEKEEAKALASQISFDGRSGNHQIRGSSVWETASGKPVVKRPLWLVIYQNGIVTLISLALCLLLGITVCPRRKK